MKRFFTFLLVGLFFAVAHQQGWAQPTRNGSIGANEYGSHTNGQNAWSDGTRTWYMTWDATNLYLAVANSGNATNDEFVIYIDTDPQTIVNGGGNANGAIGGIGGFDGVNYGQLPFRANFATFIRNGYHQHRTHNGSNGWNTNVDNSGSIQKTTLGDLQEISIAWSLMGGQPSSFNFFMYLNGGTPYGGLSNATPDNDFSNILNYTARQYFSVTSTSAFPFDKLCFVNSRATEAINNYLSSYYDVTVADSQTLNTTAALTVNNNLLIVSGSTLSLSTTSGNDLNIKGNFTNNGTFNDNSRATFFNGTNGEQTIGGTTATSFTNIAVQKASGGGTVKLLNNISLTGWIDLEDGANNTADLNLNGFNMTLGASAYLIEDQTNNNVIKDNTATTDTGVRGGYIEFTRTITASVVELAGSGLTLGRTGGSDYSVTVRRYHYIPSGNTQPSAPLNRGAKKVFQITGTPSGQTTLRIDFASEELGILTSVDMLYKWNTGLGWVKASDPSTTSPTSGMSISTGSDFVQAVGNLTSFSHWALGGNANPLPISLTSFSAEKTGKTEVTLTWQTASEINNKGFFVEKSADARDFVSLGFVEGAGNSTTTRTYQFKDRELVGKAYYRLRQVDFDGVTSFSPLVVVENDALVVYPNPVQNRLFVSVGELASDIPARLLNAQGAEVWQGTLQQPQNALQVSQFARGVYFLHMVQNGKKVVKKIILQ